MRKGDLGYGSGCVKKPMPHTAWLVLDGHDEATARVLDCLPGKGADFALLLMRN